MGPGGRDQKWWVGIGQSRLPEGGDQHEDGAGMVDEGWMGFREGQE